LNETAAVKHATLGCIDRSCTNIDEVRPCGRTSTAVSWAGTCADGDSFNELLSPRRRSNNERHVCFPQQLIHRALQRNYGFWILHEPWVCGCCTIQQFVI